MVLKLNSSGGWRRSIVDPRYQEAERRIWAWPGATQRGWRDLNRRRVCTDDNQLIVSTTAAVLCLSWANLADKGTFTQPSSYFSRGPLFLGLGIQPIAYQISRYHLKHVSSGKWRPDNLRLASCRQDWGPPALSSV
jgi:hypothetical protein